MVGRKGKVSGTVSILEPSVEIESARVALQLKLHVHAAGHCLLAGQAIQTRRIVRESMTVRVIALRVMTLVTHFDMNLFFTSSELNQPLTAPGVLRIGIGSVGNRIASPQQPEHSSHRDKPE